MAFSQALYYPSIDIRDDAWLKTSFLYWDSIRTIVPETIRAPYASEVGRALQQAGFLVPLRVHSDMEEIHELADDALTYLTTREGGELLAAGNRRQRGDICPGGILSNLVRSPMHRQKIGQEVLHWLGTTSSQESDWIDVDEGFAFFYMTLLANRLAERIGAALLTPLPAAERLAIIARLDAQFYQLLPEDPHNLDRRQWRSVREYEAFGPRRPMPRTLAPGLLSQLAIQRVAVDPDTPVDSLLEVKERYRDELALFRTKVEQLTSAVEEDLPAETLQQRVSDIYINEVEPAISNLKKALDGQRIRWLGASLLKIAFLSAGTSTVLTAAGLDVPTALLASAGLSLIVSGTTYNVDKMESLRSNPYSYLLSLERELT